MKLQIQLFKSCDYVYSVDQFNDINVNNHENLKQQHTSTIKTLVSAPPKLH